MKNLYLRVNIAWQSLWHNGKINIYKNRTRNTNLFKAKHNVIMGGAYIIER